MSEEITRPRKSKKPLVILLIILIIALIGGGTAFYLYQRKQPEQAVENFLASVQKMDFTSMENMLQSGDLSALDNADIRTSAYSDFFKTVNKKMTYKITRNKFDIQNGTAQVTAHIKYIDGSNIYKEASSEFIRQIASAAFAGKQMTEDETQQKLASLLAEKSTSVEDKFSDVDITYPVIRIGDQWKIVSLDDATVKVMSANVINVKDEISADLNSDGSSDTPAATPEADASGSIDMDGEKFSIRFTQFAVSSDYAGNPCLMLYYDYTNTSDASSSAMVDVSLQAYQNGELLTATIPEDTSNAAVDQYMNEVDPGQTVNVCQVFSLKDTTSDVTLQAAEAFNLNGGQTGSQVLKLQ